MKRGPQPKTAEQQLADGDLNKIGRNKLKDQARGTTQAGKSTLGLGIPREPPAHLSTRAKQKWRQLVPMIEDMKISNRPDATIFEGLCVNYGIYVEAYEYVQQHGVMVEEPIIAYGTVDGEKVAEVVGYRRKTNPACTVVFKAEAEVRKTAEHFGFSPVAILRLGQVKKAPVKGESFMDKLAKAPPPRPTAPVNATKPNQAIDPRLPPPPTVVN